MLFQKQKEKEAEASLFLLGFDFFKFLTELGNTAGISSDVDLASVERVALCTGIDSQFLFSGTSLEGVTTGHAGNLGTIIFRMDIFFHDFFLLTIRLKYVRKRIKQVKLYHIDNIHTRKKLFLCQQCVL